VDTGDQAKEDEMGHVACMGVMRNAHKILVGKPEVKRPLRIPRRRWKDNIKIDLRETGLEGVDWIHLIQDRGWWQALLNIAMNLCVT
jgi:hypothetical protein